MVAAGAPGAKTAIEVGEMENLVPILKLLSAATRAGELDNVQLAAKSKRRKLAKAA